MTTFDLIHGCHTLDSVKVALCFVLVDFYVKSYFILGSCVIILWTRSVSSKGGSDYC